MEKVRPKLPDALTDGELKEEELFQNMVLRPLIKMQHDLLIMRVKSHFSSKRVLFNVMDNKKRTEAIIQAFQSDHNLKKEIQGMITGQLSLVEFQQYLQMERSLNKRIIQMVRNRMIDSLFELV
jgi:hypothetical protein